MDESGAAAPYSIGDLGFYFTTEDQLRITSFNAASAVALQVSGRFRALDERVARPFAFRHVPNTDRTAATTEHELGDGWLQHLVVSVASGSTLWGQTWAIVDVLRGRGASATLSGALISALLGANARAVYPGGAYYHPLERPGTMRSLALADPAAGAEVAGGVPAGARWRVIAFAVDLVTDATVANRTVTFTIDTSSVVIYATAAQAAQTAGTTVKYVFSAAGFADAIAGSPEQVPVRPDLFMRAGYQIRTVTANLQAGDNFGAPVVLVEEWLEP